ncbi:hypothetical protein [Paraburkholderia hospita]|uniref:hypothetical protein n=1 Tax=Paraburkholderia hospita TaxID=169430 RepID=UPI001054631C|nr:hypothetical protein [Paraburkholderia hospita]
MLIWLSKAAIRWFSACGWFNGGPGNEKAARRRLVNFFDTLSRGDRRQVYSVAGTARPHAPTSDMGPFLFGSRNEKTARRRFIYMLINGLF